MGSDSGSQPPIPGMILVALVLGTVFFVEPPLEGSRPKELPRISDLPSTSEQVIPARPSLGVNNFARDKLCRHVN
jgi:hypothetical protein